MGQRREELIAELAASAKPVRPAARSGAAAIAWLAASAVFMCLATSWVAPIRAGVLAEFLTSPRFALQTLVGSAALVAFAIAAPRSAIPAAGPRSIVIAPVLLVLWLALLGLDFMAPADIRETTTNRAWCWLEVIVYALPALLVGTLALRRLWPVRPAYSGFLLGLAGGGMSAMVMQIACFREPAHALVLHVLPGLAAAVLGALLGALLLRR